MMCRPHRWATSNSSRKSSLSAMSSRLTAMTFLAALRHDRIDAPWVFDGPINAESFRLYVEEVLVAALKLGDIVVLDNLGSHKGKTIRDVIRVAGARLFFLPHYPPAPNPIATVSAH